MYEYLNDDQQLIQAAVREFVDREVRPRAAEVDRTHEFPMDLYQKAAELGLTGIIVPEEYEGAGLDMVTEAMVMEEIGRACPALALCLDVNYYTMSEILGYGAEEQKRKYLPDLATGRKIGGLSSTEAPGSSNRSEWPNGAKLEGDFWRVNVTKLLQTNCVRSGVIVMNVKTEEKGSIKLIIEREFEGVQTGAVENKIGLNGSDTGEINFVDVMVPVENELVVRPSNYYALARTDVAAICLGIAEEAFDKTFEYLTTRTKNFKPLASFGAVGSELSRIATEIELARNTIYASAKVFDEGGDPGIMSYMAKAWTSEMAVRNVARCIELFGGAGVIEDAGLARLLRDAMALCVAEGSTHLTDAIVQDKLGIQVDYL